MFLVFILCILFRVTINLKVLKTQSINCVNVPSQCHPPSCTPGGWDHIVSSIFISNIPTLAKTNSGSTYSGHITITIQGGDSLHKLQVDLVIHDAIS